MRRFFLSERLESVALHDGDEAFVYFFPRKVRFFQRFIRKRV
jgi:hypothetical protein